MRSPMALAAVMCLFTLVAYARLGESFEECARRYGPHKEEAKEPGRVLRTYKKGEYSVTVVFLLRPGTTNYVAHAISYSKPGDFVNEELSAVEVDRFLEVNAAGNEWKSKELADAPTARVWARSDAKAVALYGLTTRILEITSSDMLEIMRKEKDKKLSEF